MKKLSTVLALFSSFFALHGCGGGGSESKTIYGFLSYPVASITVLEQGAIVPNTSGFENNEPQCSLLTGSVPPGMQMARNCNIDGLPTNTGVYSFSFKLSAKGLEGETIGRGSVQVEAPKLEYKYSPKFATGGGLVVNLLTTSEVINDPPLINRGKAWPSSSTPVVWSYRVTAGTLPAGIKIDERTGVISGQATQLGKFTGFVQSSVTSSYGTLILPNLNYSVEVATLKFGYSYNGAPDAIKFDIYPSQPYSIIPYLSPPTTNAIPSSLSNFMLTALTTTISNGTTPSTVTVGLPAGLSFNSASGEISGTAAALDKIYTFERRYETTLEITVKASANQSNTATPMPVSTTFTQNFELPFYYYYGATIYETTFAGIVGRALPVLPVIKTTAVSVSNPPTRQFATRAIPSCAWDFGLALDATTGNITGSATRAGKFACEVLATVNRNGVSWRQSIPIVFDIK